MTVYSVCVGKFKETSDSKKTLKQLNEKGYKGYLFAVKDFYTLKVVTTPFMDKAEAAGVHLRNAGFDAFIC